MGGDRGTQSYAALSSHINKLYASRHGYSFHYVKKQIHGRDPRWIKILILIDFLSQKTTHDYFFWIDDDAFFNHHRMSLDFLLRRHPTKDIVICSDDKNSGRRGSLNTGTMLVRNTQWSLNFFQSIWNYSTLHHLYKCCHEQTTMERYLHDHSSEYQHVAVESETVFNSYYSQVMNNTVHSNFIIHLMATPASFRLEYMQRWLANHTHLK